jgi:hypothetical protein
VPDLGKTPPIAAKEHRQGRLKNACRYALLWLWDPAEQKRSGLEGFLRMQAQLIPSEVQQAESSRLPKDLDGQLNRIEKLSKQLRREISR